MIPSLGTVSSVTVSLGSGAGLRGLLARYEKELSACVNCSTANTAEGRQKIQELSGQIGQIKEQIAQVSRTKSGQQVATNPQDGVSAVNAELNDNAGVTNSVSEFQSLVGRLIDIVV